MAPVIIDNLHKFGLEFQSKIIAGILSEKTFLERVLDIADPEAFENEAHRWILKETFSYYLEYKSVPTLQVFRIRLDTVSNATMKEMIIDQLRVVYQKITDADLEFVREQFLEFCKNQKLKAAILGSADLLVTGDYEKIKQLVDEASKAGMERNLGHYYHAEVEKRMSEMSRKTVPTGWDVVDSLLDGGLGPGELGVILAAAGVGKSWILAAIGAAAMRKGKNVIHYTLELNENYVGLRYDCCHTGIDFQNIKNNIDAVKKRIETVSGKLFVKYYPVKTASAQTLKFHFERVVMLEGVKPDIIIVDYADILRPIEKERNSNSYSEAGGIYEELRMVAGELGVPIWTASQGNRGSATEDVVQGHNISDSYRKVMTADFIMSASRKANDKVNNTARMHIVKNRFGPDGITLYSKMNANNGDIRIYDEKSAEAANIQSIMDENNEDSESSVKKELSSKWRSLRQDKLGNDTNL
jgi:replicative DNA helicase